jgi:hypothetical protein
MRIALASHYRIWMLALFPITLGFGSAALWLRSCNWPLSIDDAGIILRRHRRVGWHSIKRIGTSRSYLDGRISEIRIYYDGGVSRVPVRALQNGQNVVSIILAMFARSNELQRGHDRVTLSPITESSSRRIETVPQENILQRRAHVRRPIGFALGYAVGDQRQ